MFDMRRRRVPDCQEHEDDGRIDYWGSLKPEEIRDHPPLFGIATKKARGAYE